MEAQQAWEKLGERGRALITEQASKYMFDSDTPKRHVSGVQLIVDLEQMTIAAHPIERVAAGSGCNCSLCGGLFINRLQNKQSAILTLQSSVHAVSLAQRFVTDPGLLVPEDVPEYALRLARWLGPAVRKSERIMRRLRREEAKNEARLKIAAQREQAALAAAKARAQAKKTPEYRLAQTQKELAAAEAELVRRNRLVQRCAKRVAKLQRRGQAIERLMRQRGMTP